MSNLKPFDLERALAGDPVVTRSGRSVTQLHLFNIETHYPLHAVVDGVCIVLSFTKGGRHEKMADEHVHDLFMAPKKVTYYFATWRERDLEYRYSSVIHPSLDYIKKSYLPTHSTKDYQIHSIEIEE